MEITRYLVVKLKITAPDTCNEEAVAKEVSSLCEYDVSYDDDIDDIHIVQTHIMGTLKDCPCE